MFVELFADKGLIAVVLLSAAVGLYWIVKEKPNVKELFPYVLMAGLTSLLAAKLMSLLPIQQARPFIQQGVEAGAAFIDNPGFPSDHALVATVVVMAVFFLTPYKRLRTCSWRSLCSRELRGCSRLCIHRLTSLVVFWLGSLAQYGMLSISTTHLPLVDNVTRWRNNKAYYGTGK